MKLTTALITAGIICFLGAGCGKKAETDEKKVENYIEKSVKDVEPGVVEKEIKDSVDVKKETKTDK